MDIRLNGKSAVITGGSKGLGLAMAQRFAASGADVAILARTPETLAEAKQQIRGRQGQGRHGQRRRLQGGRHPPGL